MAIDQKRFDVLKKNVDGCKRVRDRAEGALENVMETLLTSFSCDSIEKAEKVLEKSQKDLQKLEKSYTKKLAEFEKGWEEQIDD